MIKAPQLLTTHHDASSFNCDVSSLTEWLKRKAQINQISGASKTYVICEKNSVIGYYSLATSAVRIDEATGSIRRNMPDPIPMMLLGRLAIDTKHQGKGLGKALLRDAVLRTLQAAEIVGIRGLFVHALSDHAKEFYKGNGFHQSPHDPMMLMISLKEVQKTVL